MNNTGHEDDEDAIKVPLYTLTLTCGLTGSGERICQERTENHTQSGDGIPMMERLGMLAMAQQNATFDVLLDTIEPDENEEDGTA